ncbi:MAG: cyclic nucleotide-binding domain-containing protein [Nitrospirae bacterium]|nr:cyclic nucleotide-binding domain-containing protein [Nitrospirota bacterium]
MATEKDRVTESLQKYIKKSQWDKAIQALGDLAVMEPNNAVHRLRTGDYYLKLGHSEKAVAAYGEAAEVFAKGGFVVKALAAYKMILRLDPQNENAHAEMQGLHVQAREQAAAFHSSFITADIPPPESGPPVSVQPAEAVAVTQREPEPEQSVLSNVIPLFSSLTPEEFSEVVERMIHLQYPAGYRIVKEGDRGDSVYLISQGTVQVTTKVGNREIPLSELKDNDFFGEVGFLTGRPRTASVVTRTDTQVLELRGEDLKAIIQKYPRVREVLEGFYKSRIKDTLSKVRHTGP